MSLLNSYRCRDGDYLLSPDCMQASMHDARDYGPLKFAGTIECDDLPPRLCAETERQIEERLFALVGAKEFVVGLAVMATRPNGAARILDRD